MKPMLTTVFIIQLFIVSQNASAAGTFGFYDLRFGTVPEIKPVFVLLAKLELSGSMPYDHTNIESLTFTPDAANTLGYVGEYAGTFDESIGGFVENERGFLESSGFLTLITDNDPPPFNAEPFLSAVSSGFSLRSPSPGGWSLIASEIESPGFRSGSENALWVRIVPEPTTFSLGLLVTLLIATCRTRGDKANSY